MTLLKNIHKAPLSADYQSSEPSSQSVTDKNDCSSNDCAQNDDRENSNKQVSQQQQDQFIGNGQKRVKAKESPIASAKLGSAKNKLLQRLHLSVAANDDQHLIASKQLKRAEQLRLHQNGKPLDAQHLRQSHQVQRNGDHATAISAMQSHLPRRCSWRPTTAKVGASKPKIPRNSNLPQPVSGLVALSRITSVGTKTSPLTVANQTKRSLFSCSAPPLSRIAPTSSVALVDNKNSGQTKNKIQNNNNTNNNTNSSIGQSSSIKPPKEQLSSNCLSGQQHPSKLTALPKESPTHFKSLSLTLSSSISSSTSNNKQITQKNHLQNSNQLIDLAVSIGGQQTNQMYLNHNNDDDDDVDGDDDDGDDAKLLDLNTINGTQCTTNNDRNFSPHHHYAPSSAIVTNNGSNVLNYHQPSTMSVTSNQSNINIGAIGQQSNNAAYQLAHDTTMQYTVNPKNSQEYSISRQSDYLLASQHYKTHQPNNVQNSHYQSQMPLQMAHNNGHHQQQQQQQQQQQLQQQQQGPLWDYNKPRTSSPAQQRGLSPTYSNRMGYNLATAPANTVIGGGGGYDLAAAVMGSPPKSSCNSSIANNSHQRQQNTSSSYDNSRQYNNKINNHHHAPHQISSSTGAPHDHDRTSSPSSLSLPQTINGPSSNITSANNNNPIYRRVRSPSLSSASSAGGGYTVQQTYYQQFHPSSAYNNTRLDNNDSTSHHSSSNYQGISLAAAIRRSNSLKAGSCLDMTQTGRMLQPTNGSNTNLLIRHHQHLASHNSSGTRSGSSSRAPSPTAGQTATTNNGYADTYSSGLSSMLGSELSPSKHYSSNPFATTTNPIATNQQQPVNYSSVNSNNSYDQSRLIMTSHGASSVAYMSEVKLQHDIRKLQRDLDMERDKNTALSNQLNINSGLMAAFEQSLSTLNNRLHQLTTLTEKKDNEIETLKQKVQMYRRHHKKCNLTIGKDEEDERDYDESHDVILDKVYKNNDKSHEADDHDSINDQKKGQAVNNSSDLVSRFSDISTTSSTSESRQDDLLRCDTSVQSSSSLNVDDVTGRHSSAGSSSLNNGHPITNSNRNTNHKKEQDNIENGSKHNGDTIDEITIIGETGAKNFEKQYCLALKKIEDLEEQLREKDRLLTDSRLEALSAAHQLEQLETSMGELSFDEFKQQKISSESMTINKTPDLMNEYSNLNGIGLSPRHLRSMSPHS